MDILEVKGNTYCIDTGMTYIPFYKVNDREIIMLDTGWAKGERKGIGEALENNNFRVTAIINSHFHIDHAGNNSYLKNKYNSIIAMSKLEAVISSSVDNLKLYYGEQTIRDIKNHHEHMVFKTDIMIEKNQKEISVCGIDFKILHTPGHSPSHICIITPDEVGYVGDALISYEVMKGSKLPYAFILSEDMKSKAKLYDLNCSRYVVAHKGIYDDITKLIDDNIDFYESRAMAILDLIDRPMTFENIMKVVIEHLNIRVGSIYKHYTIERMLKSYIEYLNDIGKIKLTMDEGFLRYSPL